MGIRSRSDLIDLVREKAASGVYLTVLGFGMGNLRDGTLKQLAVNGNGNYGYIDTIEEADKVLVRELSGTLITIANDVKIQVEFNPATVGAYRLIGYENRLLRAEDFNDDTVDAGDIGAGHTVTAFYKIIPPGSEADTLPSVDPLRYTIVRDNDDATSAFADELCTVKLRYKLPGETTSALISFPIRRSDVRSIDAASRDFTFAAAVTAFGMLLRDSPHKGSADFDMVLNLAEASLGADQHGYRRGFVQMARAAKAMLSVR